MKRRICFILSFGILIVLTGQVNNIAPRTFNIVLNGNTYTIPYEASHTLGQEDPGLKYAVISLHGNNRNADDYYSNMLTAANQVPEDSDSTLIIAPQFLTETDIESFSLSTDYLYWTSGGWKAGSLSRDESSNPRSDRISSYQVIDSLIHTIADMGIEVITFAGHSAGAQVVQRYAATSPSIDENVLSARLRFVIMNPSSYAYMDEQRRVGNSLTDFAVPNTSCTAFNEWKYGLDDLFTYPSRSTKTEIRERYKNAEVFYVAGGSDNDPNSSSLDKDCEARLQGAHRLERATVFYNYIQHYYGEPIHRLDTVPGVGHNSAQMFGSAKGVFYIFQSLNGFSTALKKHTVLGGINVFPNPVEDILSFHLPEENTSYKVIISDLLGRTKYVGSTNASSNLSLDINQWPQGIYILNLKFAQGIYTQKFYKK